MKIVLLITACNQYRSRTDNQINNLKSSTIPSGIDLRPVFVFGKGSDTSNIPYETLEVDSDEKYNRLYKKLFAAYKAINEKYDYDFICKIDDDTKLNLSALNTEWLNGMDYVGRMFPGDSEFSITFDLGFYNIHKTVSLVPALFNSVPFKFATGDAYFLSKKAINHILNSEDIVNSIEDPRVCEDRLYGYILHDKDVVVNDIGLMNKEIEENILQITKDYFSIHPINVALFPSLIGKSVEEQMSIIYNNPTVNLLRRKAYIKDLENKLVETINNFVNAPKNMGLG